MEPVEQLFTASRIVTRFIPTICVIRALLPGKEVCVSVILEGSVRRLSNRLIEKRFCNRAFKTRCKVIKDGFVEMLQ